MNGWVNGKTIFRTFLAEPLVISDQPIQPIISEELNIKKGPFSPDKLEVVLNKTKNRKTVGLDDIPLEVWETSHFNNILLQSCNAVYQQQEIQVWTEGCIMPFPKKGDLGLVTNYRRITLTPIAAKIYNAMLLNRIQPELKKVLRINQNGFRKNRSTSSKIMTVRRILESVRVKNFNAVLLFVDFSKAFDSVHRGEMESILEAYGIPDETIQAVMMLYKNTRAKVRSPDGDTDFSDGCAGVLQGDTLVPFLFILCLDYMLRTSKIYIAI